MVLLYNNFWFGGFLLFAFISCLVSFPIIICKKYLSVYDLFYEMISLHIEYALKEEEKGKEKEKEEETKGGEKKEELKKDEEEEEEEENEDGDKNKEEEGSEKEKVKGESLDNNNILTSIDELIKSNNKIQNSAFNIIKRSGEKIYDKIDPHNFDKNIRIK